MIKKCLGCGSIMQFNDINTCGYVDEKDYDSSLICKRCYRMKNYGEFYQIERNNEDFIDILKSIGSTDSLVLFVVDLFTFTDSVNSIENYLINNDVLLVITKRDLMPKSIKNEKLIEYIKKINISNNILDILIVSSEKNDGLDDLYNKIIKYKNNKKVYVVGNTNAGKSTLINKLVRNYSDNDSLITTSILPSTTLNQINVKLNDNLTLVDTPGLIDASNIINYINVKDIKKITPKREIKPKTFQLKKGKSIEIDKYIKLNYIDGKKNSFTAYFSNSLLVNQFNNETHLNNFSTDNYEKNTYKLNERQDIVINGLGYIKIVEKAIIDVYAPKNVKIIIRNSMI